LNANEGVRKGDMSKVSVGVIYKHHFEPSRLEAKRLEGWLAERGVAVFSEEMSATVEPNGLASETSTIPPNVNWIVVLGGDGTLLGAARKVGRFGIPVLGINLGGLGFLTEIPLKNMYPAIEKMLAGDLEIERRIMLDIKVMRQGKEVCCFLALNDVVITNRGPLARIFDLDVYINQDLLTTFRGDGLIIATPTGSTAYSLAAGGPILYPTMANIMITPICPFTLTNRPIILPDRSIVKILMGKESEERVNLTFDGQVGFDFLYRDEVMIMKSGHGLNLVKSPDQGYFEILRTKLMWGGAPYNNGENQ
jgi:NAD+ kinase